MVKISAPRPLAQTDNRADFDCGHAVLNYWFQRHAWGNEKVSASRTYVIMDEDAGRVAGYVTLATGQIEREFLHKAKQRNMPDPVPVIVLGQLAIDQAYQGQGLGADLLRFALELAMTISTAIGAAGVLTHPLYPEVAAFYERWGFTRLDEDPKGSMFVRMKDLLAIKQ
jgi:GNAT superfamily N-acetyltransferase